MFRTVWVGGLAFSALLSTATFAHAETWVGDGSKQKPFTVSQRLAVGVNLPPLSETCSSGAPYWALDGGGHNSSHQYCFSKEQFTKALAVKPDKDTLN